jgi:hypothetical protein
MFRTFFQRLVIPTPQTAENPLSRVDPKNRQLLGCGNGSSWHFPDVPSAATYVCFWRES